MLSKMYSLPVTIIYIIETILRSNHINTKWAIDKSIIQVMFLNGSGTNCVRCLSYIPTVVLKDQSNKFKKHHKHRQVPTRYACRVAP